MFMQTINWMDVIKNFPNFAGLVILSATLWLIYQDGRQENATLRDLMVACFTSQGLS